MFLPAQYLDYIIIFGAQFLPFVLVFSLGKLWQEKRRVLAFKSVVAAGLALAAAEIIKHFFYTPRPFAVGDAKALIRMSSAEAAFPSSHTAALTAMAVALFRKKGNSD